MTDPRLDQVRKLSTDAQTEAQAYIQNGKVADARVMNEIIFKLCGAINTLADVIQGPPDTGGGVAFDTRGGSE